MSDDDLARARAMIQRVSDTYQRFSGTIEHAEDCTVDSAGECTCGYVDFTDALNDVWQSTPDE